MRQPVSISRTSRAWLCEPIDLDEDALVRAIGSWDRPALLMGGASFGLSGRWSYLAAEPVSCFEATDDRYLIGNDTGFRWRGHDPLQAMARLLDTDLFARDLIGDPTGLPPFRGGWIGHLGYDLAPLIEDLPRRRPRDSRIPDIRLALYDTFVAIDHLNARAFLCGIDLCRSGAESLESRFSRWQDRLARDHPPPRPSARGRLVSSFDRPGYLDAVQTAREYIAAGDIFQVNLSQRFESEADFEPLDLFLRLRRRSPAPFSAFLKWDDLAVVSASPEWFYRVEGLQIETRPIKGTRPRHADPVEDARLARELLASPKDRAELTMIVDLERNDLGRICEYGSVQVRESRSLESYAQVHHLVAFIQGRLRSEIGPIDVIRAVFPGGSITGAPKIRAMQIIDELEPLRRSLYTGSIGYISAGGDSMFNIAIRTILVEGPRASFGVGGGLVIDSDPASEYDETLHKGRGLRDVLEGWGLES